MRRLAFGDFLKNWAVEVTGGVLRVGARQAVPWTHLQRRQSTALCRRWTWAGRAAEAHGAAGT